MVKIICICGLDGAGKTTLINHIMTYYKLKGLKMKVINLRWRAFLTLTLHLYSRTRKRTKSIRLSNGIKISIDLWHEEPVLTKLTPAFLTFDSIIMYTWLKMLSLLTFRDLIICDRFFLDTLVDLSSNIGKEALTSVYLRFVAYILKKVNYCIVLIVHPSISLVRKDDIVSYEDLITKWKIYRYLARLFKLEILDTSNLSVFNVRDYVINELASILKSKGDGLIRKY
jgi:thymidylate kinase